MMKLMQPEWSSGILLPVRMRRILFLDVYGSSDGLLDDEPTEPGEARPSHPSRIPTIVLCITITRAQQKSGGKKGNR